MHIGLFIDSYYSHSSGVTRYVQMLHHQLCEYSHKVSIFYFSKESGRENNFITSKGFKGPRGYYYGFSFSSEAKRIISTIDIAHVNHPIFSGLQCVKACREFNIPIIYTHHTRSDEYFPIYLSKIGSVLPYFVYKKLIKSFLKNVDLVISPSKDLVHLLTEWCPKEKIQVLNNPVMPIGYLNNNQEQNVVRDENKLIFIGRIEKEKNIFFLLEMFTEVIKAFPKTKLAILGNGKYLTELKKIIKSKRLDNSILLPGWVSPPNVEQWLIDSDIFVTASKLEVFPLSTLEALSAGVPVIALDAPGNNEIIIDNYNGFLVKEDVNEFSKRIIELFSNAEMYAKMRINCRETARIYSLDQHTEKLLSIYNSLIIQK